MAVSRLIGRWRVAPYLCAGLLSVAACAPGPPPDRPYLSAADVRRQVAAIDAALSGDAALDWQGAGGRVRGAVVPGPAYTDHRGRDCREVELSERSGPDLYTRTEKFCLGDEGRWLPDLPPGAGGGAAVARPDTHQGAADPDLDLRRRYANEKRRLERRFDGKAEVRRGLRRAFTLEERRRVE